MTSSDDITRYILTTGETGAMFTLRKEIHFKTYDGRGNPVVRTHNQHICNLSTDFEKAKAKAQAKLPDDAQLEIHARQTRDIERTVVRRPQPNHNFMPFGKYDDRCWQQVLRDDPEYLAWFCEEFAGKSDGQSKHNWKMFIISKAMPLLHQRGHMVEGVSLRTWKRQQRKQREQRRREASQHIGEAGERLEGIEARVVFYTSFETRYGTRHLYKLRTRDGNTLAWFTGSMEFHSLTRWLTSYDFLDQAIDDDADLCFRFNATVKKHDTYKGEDQTVVQRVHVSTVLFKGFELDVAECDKWDDPQLIES